MPRSSSRLRPRRRIARARRPVPPAAGSNACAGRASSLARCLTDDDLNRLEHYVVAKDKLHNRYFHGSGVVCGLEVVCDPCSATNVTVKPGYALSPCGEDIIVCKDASVNVCDLINHCKPRRNDCDPYGAQTPADCKQGIQRFVLSICYSETPSRGVQPLDERTVRVRVAEASCGGSCGCGGSKPTATAGTASATPVKPTTKTPSKYNAQCEPTLICEGFSFTANKYAPATANSDVSRFGVWGVIATKATQFGPLFTRLMLCYFKALEIKSAYTAQAYTKLDTAQLAVTYSEYGAALREFAATHVAHRCDLARKLACLDMPATLTTNVGGGIRKTALSKEDYVSRIEALNTLWLEVLRECFCSALLPPCGGPEASDCIPLAVVTIDVDKCQVIEICNWQARKFALTLPSIFYWTSFINWGAIKDAIAKLCCGTADQRIWETIFVMMEKTAAANAGMTQVVPDDGDEVGVRAGRDGRCDLRQRRPPSGNVAARHLHRARRTSWNRPHIPKAWHACSRSAQPAAQTASDIASLRQRVDALHNEG